MLRRYLITNLVSTALLYAGYMALVRSRADLAAHMSQGFESYSMESSMLAPLLHRIVTVSGR